MTPTDTWHRSRRSLHLVAVHVLANARHEHTGRFGLRAAPGGFATPAFGPEVRRLRVDGDLLVDERAGGDGSATTVVRIDGATLEELADAVGVRLDPDLRVGHDTPSLPPAGERLAVDPRDADVLGPWFALTQRALDRVVAGLDPRQAPTAAQLWPEHFDLALDVAQMASGSADRRVNLGGSAGDAGHEAPYLYVGPWTPERPGPDGYWNAPFGAVLGWEAVQAAPDPLAAAVGFLTDGLGRLATA